MAGQKKTVFSTAGFFDRWWGAIAGGNRAKKRRLFQPSVFEEK